MLVYQATRHNVYTYDAVKFNRILQKWRVYSKSMGWVVEADYNEGKIYILPPPRLQKHLKDFVDYAKLLSTCL